MESSMLQAREDREHRAREGMRQADRPKRPQQDRREERREVLLGADRGSPGEDTMLGEGWRRKRKRKQRRDEEEEKCMILHPFESKRREER